MARGRKPEKRSTRPRRPAKRGSGRGNPAELKQTDPGPHDVERRLREQLEEAEHLYDTVPIGLSFVDEDLRFVRISEQLAAWNGKPISEHIGKRVSEVTPEIAETLEPIYVRVLETGEPVVGLEFRGPAPADPSVERDWLVSYHPLKRADQTVRGVHAIVQDVTKRKRAEQALRESEEKLRAVVETAPDFITLLDREGRFTFVNRTIPQYTVEELLGRKCYDFMLPEYHETFRKCLQKVFDTGEPQVCEMRAEGADGISWFKVRFAAVRQGEEIGAVLNLGTDITEHVRREEALHESEEKWRSLVETAPDFVTLLDREGTILYVNRVAPEYDLDDVVGKRVYEFVLPEDRETFRATFKAVLDTGEPAECEVRLDTLAGISWQTIRLAAMKRGDHVRRVTAISTDITGRKQMEEQLRHSQKMEAVGRLAGGLAHDLNNLFTVVRGYCDLILEDLGSDDAIRGEIEEIRGAGERAAGLTNQLLVFSRQEVTKPRRVSLSTVAADTEKMLQRLLGEDIELIARLDPSTGSVMADPGQIQQILLNLAVNSRDAMPEGGILTIETAGVDVDEDEARKHEVRPGRYVRLGVRDTGVGMDGQTQSRIFEPFFTTKEPGRGTGLGLSVVYGIVQQSGGYVQVGSKLGEGTAFQIFFPCVDEAPEASDSRSKADTQFLGTETVLLVEDDQAVREVARLVLEKAGYRVLTAGDGKQALRILSETKNTTIDLLLSDLVMPGMRGQRLAKRVAARYPSLRTLFMSGHADEPIPDGPFLKKPFSAEALLQKVRDTLDAPRKTSGS